MAETTNSTSRRAVIMGLAGTPFLAGTIAAAVGSPATAAATGPDAEIIEAWRAYRHATFKFNNTPGRSEEDYERQEAEWDAVVAPAGQILRNAHPATVAGAIALLWSTLDNLAPTIAAHNAVMMEDAATLSRLTHELDEDGPIIARVIFTLLKTVG